MVIGNKTGDRLASAILRNRALSREGFLEHLFAWMFKGLVYPQIWEDPEVDMEALALTRDCHVVAIASGGCNVLSYLTADPARITAVDLNKAHVALNRLKLAAARHLPSWEEFYRFFGHADARRNVAAYWRFVAPHLDPETRAYWEGRRAFGLGQRRISMFARNVYRQGLLGRFIGLGHLVARALWRRSAQDAARALARRAAPVLRDRARAAVRQAAACAGRSRQQLSLFGLGIPPAQYAALASARGGDMAAVLRGRMERLTCAFSLDDNYFAWQAFGRSYSDRSAGPLPPYLRRENFDAIRERAGRVEVFNDSFTEYLAQRPGRSLDRYVLLDAQDWMTDAQLNALWREITRTARPGARVIFRTAAEPSLLPGRVESPVLNRWRYEAEQSRDLTARDRSAIYGGFHLYVLEG